MNTAPHILSSDEIDPEVFDISPEDDKLLASMRAQAEEDGRRLGPSAFRAGRGAPPPEAVVVRELDEQDLLDLREKAQREVEPRGRGNSGPSDLSAPLLGPAPSAVLHFRASHHNVARLFAQGYDADEIIVLTGYSRSRLSVFNSDPAFQDLVETYRRELRGASVDVAGVLNAVALDAVQELRDRMETSPAAISNKDLLGVAKLGLDRSGYGPQSSTLNKHMHIHASAEEIARLREEAQQNARQSVTVVEGRHVGEPNGSHALPAPSEGVPDGAGLPAADDPSAEPQADDGDPAGGAAL